MFIGHGAWHVWRGMTPADRTNETKLLTGAKALWGWEWSPEEDPTPRPTLTLGTVRAAELPLGTIYMPNWTAGGGDDLKVLATAMNSAPACTTV